MKCNKLCTKAVSMLLALCMIVGILPVMAFAGEETDGIGTLPNMVTDTFSDGRYVNGVTYRWNDCFKYPYVTKTVADGALAIKNEATSASNSNYASIYLSARDAATGTDYAAKWTDYTVESRLKLTGDNLVDQSRVGIMGRFNILSDGSPGFYIAYLRNTKNNVFLAKAWINPETNKWTLTDLANAAFTFAADTYYTLSMSFDGSNISVSVDGNEYITHTDETYSEGSAGLQLTRIGDAAFDYIKVIHNDDSTAIADDFNDSRYFDGVTYKWNPDNGDAWQTKDDVYNSSVVIPEPVAVTARWNEKEFDPYGSLRTENNYAVLTNEATRAAEKNYVDYYLSLFDAENKNHAINWADYSVEIKGKLTSFVDQSKLQVMGRTQLDSAGVYSYYAAGIMYRVDSETEAKSLSRSVFLYKYSGDGTTAATVLREEPNFFETNASISDEYTIKMTFSGNTISVFINGAECFTYTDEEPVLKCGGAGVRVVRKSVAYLDYIKVTDSANNTLFQDQFADSNKLTGETGYVLDKTYNVGEIPGEAGEVYEVTASWVDWNNGSETQKYVEDNIFNISKSGSSGTSTNYNLTYLALSGEDQKHAWSNNYSIEAKIKVGALSTRTEFSLLGRVTANADGSFSFYKAYVRNDKAHIWLYKTTVAADGTETNTLLTDPGVNVGFSAGTFHTIKMEFVGKTINLYVNSSTTPISCTDNDIYTSGTVGMQLARLGTANIDYIKVADLNNNILFEDQFADNTFFAGKPGYLYDGVFTTEEPELPDDPVPTPANTDSSSILSVTSGSIDIAHSWTDYAVETDFMLQKSGSAAGILSRAIGDKYYEMRVTEDKVALITVNESGETELISALQPTDVGVWYYGKMELDGTNIKCYINGVEILAWNTQNDTVSYAAGSAGLRTTVAVAYDNFAVFSIEANENRKFTTHKFRVNNPAKLTYNWNINAEDWSVSNNTLISDAQSDYSIATLKIKASVDDYYAEAKASAPDGASVGVTGRVSIDGSAYYSLTATIGGNVTLTKVVGTDVTDMGSVGFLDLYQMGIKLEPGKEFALRIQMYRNVVEGYINGIRVLRAVDENAPLTAGVGGVFGTAGAAFSSLTIGQVDVVTKITVVDSNGAPVANSTAPVKVPLGKVPDIKHLWLKVEYYDGTTDAILLDKTNVEDFDGTTVGAKQAKVEYLNASTVFYYTVETRAEDIAQLDQELSELQIPTSLDEEDDIKNLFRSYSDLSSLELAGAVSISDESKKNLFNALEAIEFLRYPELKGTDVVFCDRFDTAASAARYEEDSATLTWRGNPGNWYIENGTMLQYMPMDHTYPVRLGCSAVVMDENGVPENWEIRSVSVDVQFVDALTRAGIDFCFGGSNEERYTFHITDKSHRITLGKNNVTLKQLNSDKETDPVEFAPGVWYNLRVTLDGNGLIKCYVDDRLWIEYQDVPTVQNDSILTHGSVALYSSENYVRYDNLVVRGTDLDPDNSVDYKNSISQDYIGGTGKYSDDFDDEKTAGVINQNPSHWIELNTEDKWFVKEIEDPDYINGKNLVYASKNNTNGNSHTWLHVFETNVDFSAKVKVTNQGYFPIVALSSRVNADESYIRGGYDFTLQKWFISVRLGADFNPTIEYAEEDTDVDFFTDGVTLRMKLVGETIELYADNELVVSADAGIKVMPGRVGVYTEQCNVEVDDVELKLLSGQGRVNDGVLEYYTNTGSSYHSILEMWDDEGNQILLLYQDGVQSISMDGGQTFTPSTMYSSNGFKGNSALELHDGTYINIKRRGGSAENASDRVVYFSNDGGKTWPEVGTVPIIEEYNYAQPAEHINEVRLNETTWRVFYTLTNGTLGCSETFYTDYVEGMENFGEVWHTSKNTPKDFTNSTGWNESYVIQISKDTKDINGREIKAGTLIQYSSHNSLDSMRYTLSFDGGETWVGDYAMPQIPCGTNSCCIKEDPYEPGTYYMTAPYNIPVGLSYNHPRFRVVLLRSYDGLNWEFLADVDRWGQVTDGVHANIMQQVNAYLCITEDYVFPIFSRSDQLLADADHSHHLQIGRMYRFEKDKLDAYDVWPQEYIVPDKAITSIELVPGKTEITRNDNDPLAGSKIKLNYYNAKAEYIDLADVIDLNKNADASRAFVKFLDDMTTVGNKSIVVDYKHFRTICTVDVVMGDTPALSVEDGKTYCGEQEVTVTDANGDLVSVTLNGTAVTLTDGKFTVTAKEGQQTIVATDKAGNVTTVMITVNVGHAGGTATCEDKAECSVCGEAYGELAAHKGGTATCTDKAKCEVCGEEYGEKNADTHSGEAKWSYTDEKHTKKYECCGAVAVAEVAHKLTDGKCECGYEAPAPVEPGEIENATDADKNACGGTLDVKDEHLSDKLLTEEEKAEVQAGADIEISLKIEDISDKVSAADKAAVENKLNGMKVGLYLDINMEKKVGDKAPVRITKTNGGVTVTITVPAELINTDAKIIRTYKVIRVHEGVADILDAIFDAKTGKLSFETDKFSTYTLVYSDAPSSDNSNTGDSTMIVLFGCLLALSALAAAVLLVPDVRKKLMCK